MPNSGKIISIVQDDQFRTWFEKIYAEHFERLYRYAYSITKHKQLAEDVVSEVFLNIWNKRPNYDDINEVSSYLFVSVKHLAIRMASKDPGKFTYSTYDEALKISDSIDPEQLLINSELKVIVEQILEKLSPQCVLIYDMVKNKGFTHQQIAHELGISKKTVSNQMNLILNKMREGLKIYFKDSANKYTYLMKISRVISLLFFVNIYF